MGQSLPAVISVVDDDDGVRRSMQVLLGAFGYDVHTFASAEEFLISPDLQQTSCVISDVQMPGLSGIELQEFLRTKGYRIPVILITAFPDEHVRRRAMQAGAAAFLDKPVSEANLMFCLARKLKTA